MIKINTKLIKQRMAELNLSVAGLSRAAELSITTVLRLFNGESHNYYSYTIYKITEILDLRMNDLIKKAH